MSTTLIDHCDTRLAALQAQTGALQATLPALRATEQTQRSAVQAARQQLQDTDVALAQLRAQLAAVELPAAGDPLLRSLQQKRIARAEDAAALLAAEDTLVGTQLDIAHQQQELDEAGRRAQQVQAVRSQQLGPHAARQALLGRLAGARLPVQDDAAARNAAEGAAARAQLEQDFPATLLARLSARHAHLGQVQARVVSTRDALADLQAGLDPGTRQARAARHLADAEAAGTTLADHAAAAVAASTAVLTSLAARPPRLSAEEKAALAATPVATAEMSTRSDAIARQADFDTQRLALAAADGERRRVHLGLLLEDPADYPPAAGTRKVAFDAAQSAFDAARTAFDAANTAYGPQQRKALDDWLAGVSDALWGDLERYLDARASLAAIDAVDPAALRSAITDAEAALVDAVEAADTALGLPTIAARAVQAVEQWLREDPGANGRRLHEGLRGAP